MVSKACSHPPNHYEKFFLKTTQRLLLLLVFDLGYGQTMNNHQQYIILSKKHKLEKPSNRVVIATQKRRSDQ